MHVQVLTIFPQLFEPFLTTSLIGRARERGLLDVSVHDLRHHTSDRHRSVDDEPYGGGGGMVMTAQPWLSAVRTLSSQMAASQTLSSQMAASQDETCTEPWRILMSPQGRRLDETKVRQLAERPRLLLLCGRYEGIDERVRMQVVDEELSIGDFVLSGGELPAMVLIEALSRQIPGVVQLADSVEQDSFRHGLLDYPHYTRPREIEGLEVPEVLLSGHHGDITAWRRRRALEATLLTRPDLFAGMELEDGERRELASLCQEHGISWPPGLQRPE